MKNRGLTNLLRKKDVSSSLDSAISALSLLGYNVKEAMKQSEEKIAKDNRTIDRCKSDQRQDMVGYFMSDKRLNEEIYNVADQLLGIVKDCISELRDYKDYN